MSDERKMITPSDLKDGQAMDIQHCDLSGNVMLSNVYTYNVLRLSGDTFDSEMVISNVTASLSAVPNLNSISEWSSGDKQKRLDFIRDECLARLKDVRETNEKAKSLSAFMSILALIGMLAKLAFSKNTSFKPKYSNGCGPDQAQFQAFCDCYLLEDSDYVQKVNDIGLSYLLYKYVRCGLLHGGTLTNTKVTTKPICVKVCLTHRGSSEQTLVEMNSEIIKQASAPKEVNVILDATFLCDELEKAIRRMFSDARQDVRNSILETFEKEPPILCANKK